MQKLIFGHFWNCKKWILVKIKVREIELFDFTSFFGRGLFFIFLSHCEVCVCKLHIKNAWNQYLFFLKFGIVFIFIFYRWWFDPWCTSHWRTTIAWSMAEKPWPFCEVSKRPWRIPESCSWIFNLSTTNFKKTNSDVLALYM